MQIDQTSTSASSTFAFTLHLHDSPPQSIPPFIHDRLQYNLRTRRTHLARKRRGPAGHICEDGPVVEDAGGGPGYGRWRRRTRTGKIVAKARGKSKNGGDTGLLDDAIAMVAMHVPIVWQEQLRSMVMEVVLASSPGYPATSQTRSITTILLCLANANVLPLTMALARLAGADGQIKLQPTDAVLKDSPVAASLQSWCQSTERPGFSAGAMFLLLLLLKAKATLTRFAL